MTHSVNGVSQEPTSRTERHSVEPSLRAMSRNYSNRHSWDHLDAEVCIQAADEIKVLRAALSAMLTHAGMDEDDFNKVTFDQARAALRASGEKT